MPIVDCGFSDIKEASGRNRLIHFGPTVLVNIGFDTDHDYANTAGAPPKSQASELPALIDTGASESCIDSALAESINLPVIDRQTVCGVGGETEVNIYLGHTHIPSILISVDAMFSSSMSVRDEAINRAPFPPSTEALG